MPRSIDRVRVAADLNRTLAYGCAISEPPQNDSFDVSAGPPKASTLPLNSRNAGRFRWQLLAKPITTPLQPVDKDRRLSLKQFAAARADGAGDARAKAAIYSPLAVEKWGKPRRTIKRRAADALLSALLSLCALQGPGKCSHYSGLALNRRRRSRH
jgi:hypothetical protein